MIIAFGPCGQRTSFHGNSWLKEKEIHEARPFLCNNLQGFQGIGEGVPWRPWRFCLQNDDEHETKFLDELNESIDLSPYGLTAYGRRYKGSILQSKIIGTNLFRIINRTKRQALMQLLNREYEVPIFAPNDIAIFQLASWLLMRKRRSVMTTER